MKPFITDLICFSHLRWGFVFQRPQHLMSRFARDSRVFFFEEPIWDGETAQPRYVTCPKTGVRVMTPIVPSGATPEQAVAIQRRLLGEMCSEQGIEDFAAWYYTPMALNFTSSISPSLTVYDCMDELSAFAGAPPAMHRNERLLFEKADLVFTGGRSLFEWKRRSHTEVHLFPSTVDVSHFAQARTTSFEPKDQLAIPHPRLGFIGVIDERMDLDLLAHVARSRPQWQIVIVGPVVKIDPATLPRAANIHYLGMKSYEDLPGYLAGWDIAMLPFAQNESTRFVSPTKTPEYLAAGCPVVSTPIRDVVFPYGEIGLVKIGNSAQEFVAMADEILERGMQPGWDGDVKAFLNQLSWDRTWAGMRTLMEQRLSSKAAVATPPLAMSAAASLRRAR